MYKNFSVICGIFIRLFVVTINLYCTIFTVINQYFMVDFTHIVPSISKCPSKIGRKILSLPELARKLRFLLVPVRPKFFSYYRTSFGSRMFEYTTIFLFIYLSYFSTFSISLQTYFIYKATREE